MRMSKLKRMFIMPFANKKRVKYLEANTMLPEEILAEMKKYHDAMLVSNKKANKTLELEFMHKRDALRKVLRISGEA
jgi:hypothetical protein